MQIRADLSGVTIELKNKGISLAIVNAMGNLAQIYGSYLFPSDDAPKYLMGFGVIIFIILHINKEFARSTLL